MGQHSSAQVSTRSCAPFVPPDIMTMIGMHLMHPIVARRAGRPPRGRNLRNEKVGGSRPLRLHQIVLVF
jgi:hypothetical protein